GFRKRCSCPTDRVVPCLVLDPFAGSGTVLAVARRMGRRSVGIELNPDYVALARRRSAADVPAVVGREEASA
ncbi:DNA methylase N-4/N-6 domain protein, partial [mine drainage metagenome]